MESGRKCTGRDLNSESDVLAHFVHCARLIAFKSLGDFSHFVRESAERSEADAD